MLNLRRIFILIFCLTASASCDKPNVLTEYSKIDGDEALFYKSQQLIDSENWDSAITILTTTLSASYRSQAKVKERLMYAYGGKCGINFMNLINSLKTVSSSRIFDLALKVFAQKATDITACDNSITILHQLGATASVRTSSQNIYAALLGLTRLAVAIKTKMDTDSSGLGDGVVDAGWNSCVPGSTAGKLSDAEIDKVATGIGLIFENLSYLSGQLSSGGAGAIFNSAKTLCESSLPAIGAPVDYDGTLVGKGWNDLPVAPVLPASPKYSDFGFPSYFDESLSCTNTLDTSVSTFMRIVMRRLIASSSMGFGTCDIANISLSFTFDTTGAPPFDRPVGDITSNCCPNLDP